MSAVSYSFEDQYNRVVTILSQLDHSVAALIEQGAADDLVARFQKHMNTLQTSLATVRDDMEAVLDMERAILAGFENLRGDTYTIAGGSTSYVVTHNLGYKPIVEILDSANVKVQIMTVHIDTNAFIISGVSTSFTGTVLYY